jgi:lipopolysaccharide/colanic/teichoic acid biosynthesis glycosyltransferase
MMEDDLAADSAVGLRPLRTRQRGKRTVDLLLCVLALPLVLSVCLLVAIVLAVGQRQVLYRAQRVGRNGRPFTMLKFATMRPGDAGPRVTRERDPRITPIGRWLRATKLNELPQVFNVIKGDMSIVGPRPEDPRYVAFFTTEQTEVLQVRPGLVSPAYLVFGDEQTFIECADPADIEAYYVRELLPEKLRIEHQYLQAWSIAGDLRIVARTAARLINCSGGSHG